MDYLLFYDDILGHMKDIVKEVLYIIIRKSCSEFINIFRY